MLEKSKVPTTTSRRLVLGEIDTRAALTTTRGSTTTTSEMNTSNEDKDAWQRAIETQCERRSRRHQEQCEIIRQLMDRLQMRNERVDGLQATLTDTTPSSGFGIEVGG